MSSSKKQKTSTLKHKPNVKYIHLRNAPDEHEGKDATVSNMGGATLAYCFTESLKEGIVELRLGLACCSVNDNFCKEKGRTISKHRLEGHPNYWSAIVELEPEDVVQLSQLEIIQYAYENWPDELATWGIDADFMEAELKEAKSGTATRVQI